MKLKTAEKADENGSVNAGRITEMLVAQGKQLDEKDVRLDAPIKPVGTHAARVHIHCKRFAEVTVEVAAAD